MKILALFIPMFLIGEVGQSVTLDSPLISDEIESAGFVFDRYPPVYYSNAHHWLALITVCPNHQYTLELEDGSTWKIHNYDGVKALTWRANDPLTITQNTRWFSQHAYRIINQTNGSSVEATLFLGPLEQGAYSRYISHIDWHKSEVVLNDNTAWLISHSDHALFRKWEPTDYIIIGTNSDRNCWEAGSDTLLINVNMNNAVRAKQL